MFRRHTQRPQWAELTEVYAVCSFCWWEIAESMWIRPRKLRHRGGVRRQNNLQNDDRTSQESVSEKNRHV